MLRGSVPDSACVGGLPEFDAFQAAVRQQEARQAGQVARRIDHPPFRRRCPSLVETPRADECGVRGLADCPLDHMRLTAEFHFERSGPHPAQDLGMLRVATATEAVGNELQGGSLARAECPSDH
jgi:hypothetical protein